MTSDTLVFETYLIKFVVATISLIKFAKLNIDSAGEKNNVTY